MGEYYNLNAVETVADPENITGFTVANDGADDGSNLNGSFTKSGSKWRRPRSPAGYYEYYKSGTRWRFRVNNGEESSTSTVSFDDTQYPWQITNWLGNDRVFSNFVGGSIISKFNGDVTRPVGLSPNTGSVTDYFCYYKTWTGQLAGGSLNSESLSLGDFGTWTLIKNDAGSDNVDADLIFIRKSDRKAIQITGDLFTPGSITVTDVTNVNYPELQRLRYLGYA